MFVFKLLHLVTIAVRMMSASKTTKSLARVVATTCEPVSRKRTRDDEQGQRKQSRLSNTSDLLKIHCDGSSLGNGKPTAKAGFAVVMSGQVVWQARCPGRQTNQRAELMAAMVAAAFAERHERVEIHSDSEYALKGVTEPSRLATWARNGWKTKAGTPVANVDLWRQMHKILQRRKHAPIAWKWVKGHSGDPGNELADTSANAAAVGDWPAHEDELWPATLVGYKLNEL